MDPKEIARFFALISKVGPEPVFHKLRRFVAYTQMRDEGAIQLSALGIARAVRILSGEDESDAANAIRRNEIEPFLQNYRHVKV